MFSHTSISILNTSILHNYELDILRYLSPIESILSGFWLLFCLVGSLFEFDFRSEIERE